MFIPTDSDLPSWFKKRSYLHFDSKVSLDKTKEIVLNPKAVSSHAFYPFIKYSVISEKVSKDQKTNKISIKKKIRDVAYSSHMDSHIYSYYSEMLTDIYEKRLQEKNLHKAVLAFRKLDGKSNIHFAHDAFMYIKSKRECSAIALDFSKFFNTLDHKILQREWSNILKLEKLPDDHYKVFRSLTKYSEVNRDKLFEIFDISPYNPKLDGKGNSKIKQRHRICSCIDFREKVRKAGLIESNKSNNGIPQGSPISALLSNIYMLTFDEKMNEYANSINGRYFRYCDDMLFIVPVIERDKVQEYVKNEIGLLKVEINESKTEIRDFKVILDKVVSFENDKLKPLQYLGFLFDGTSAYLRSASLSRYSEKMKGGIKLAKMTMEKENKIRLSKGEPAQTKLYKRKLHCLYSHRGQRNFLSYGYRAANIMNSKSIKRQLKPLWKRFQMVIEK
ncbi:antiviral reverse transcriptase Drt2 [Shewanella oncorhynchi]|uniref:antiviral reverse transcriptase Drt2 n=1 Tax=Shewanella oncorhynchi TaxID=2726434 RepID=UPI003D793143